jgi:membrane protein insertase Oxa1/YidC/SpoIIIJ
MDENEIKDEITDDIFDDFDSRIEKIMKETNELQKVHKLNQEEFNKRFLVKLMIFMFFYRFYSMHIDPQGKLINWIDEFITEYPEPEHRSPSPIIIDDLD